MVALFSYEATQPEDLEFQEGDIIQIISMGRYYSWITETNFHVRSNKSKGREEETLITYKPNFSQWFQCPSSLSAGGSRMERSAFPSVAPVGREATNDRLS